MNDDEYHVSLLKVRGASGRLLVPKGHSVKWTITTLQVRLDDGRCLEVRTSTRNEGDMVRIADSLQVKAVDTSWLGRH